MSSQVRILDAETVEALLDTGDLVDALAAAMVELSAGTASMPPRIGSQVPERDGVLLVMPAYLPSTGSLSIKAVSLFPHNVGDVPTHHAVVVAFDATTGAPRAVLDGTYLTAARTAAGSALATRLLARVDAGVVAVLGTGTQARSHAAAMTKVRPVREIRVAGRSQSRAQALADELAEALSLPVHASGSYAEALDRADIVCAATLSPDPVVRREWLSPGTHVNSVGFGVREVDAATVADALVAVESRESALAPGPAGALELVAALESGVDIGVVAEIGELVDGSATGRTSEQQITLYKSVGVAVQDAAAASLVLAAAERADAGTLVNL